MDRWIDGMQYEETHLRMFHDRVVDGLEGRGDVLHHGRGDAGQETDLHGGHQGVNL